MTTRTIVSNKLTAYLNHRITLAELVLWAENALLEGGIDDKDPKVLMQVLGRLGAADAQGFGLLWEDCQEMLRSLGYQVEVQVTKAA